MKRRNENHRGEVCGVRAARAHTERPARSTQVEQRWARVAGVRPAIVGASLALLEQQLNPTKPLNV